MLIYRRFRRVKKDRAPKQMIAMGEKIFHGFILLLVDLSVLLLGNRSLVGTFARTKAHLSKIAKMSQVCQNASKLPFQLSKTATGK